MNPQNYNPNQPQNPYPNNNGGQIPPYPPQQNYQGNPTGAYDPNYQNGFSNSQTSYPNSQPNNGSNFNQPFNQQQQNVANNSAPAAQNFLPNQDYATAQTQNPYSIEYLNSIAPKTEANFWTKGKIFLAIFAAVGVLLSLWFIIFGNSGNVSNNEATVNSYFHIVQIRTIAEEYQQRLRGTDISAINAGMVTSLKADQVALEKYMTEKKIDFPTEKKLAKSAGYSKISKNYTELSETLNNAFLNTTIDGVYAREMSYQLSLIKGNLLKLEKRLGSKASKTLEPIVVNFDTSIKALNEFKE